MPRRSMFQTKGVGYGNYLGGYQILDHNGYNHGPLQSGYNPHNINNQAYLPQSYTQPHGHLQQMPVQSNYPVSPHGYYHQPTGINSGMHLSYNARNSALNLNRSRSNSSSSRSSDQSPSRLDEWRQRRAQKKMMRQQGHVIRPETEIREGGLINGVREHVYNLRR